MVGKEEEGRRKKAQKKTTSPWPESVLNKLG